MRIVICHNCWSWVPLEGTRCPDCHRDIDLNEADPSPDELSALFGQPRWPLGRVRCERKPLPSVGWWLGATGGLMFLPELTALPNGALDADELPAAGLWQMPRWWPFWTVRRSGRAPTAPSWPLDVEELSQRFLKSPGAVFVPHRQLIRAALRGRTWTVSRTVGRTLRLTALSPADEIRHAWSEMLLHDAAHRSF
jgi:hypothetical protein